MTKLAINEQAGRGVQDTRAETNARASKTFFFFFYSSVYQIQNKH